MRDDLLDDEIYLPKADTLENKLEVLRLKSEYFELHDKVKHARTAIWWLAGLHFVGGMIECAQYNFDPLMLGISLGIVSFFVIMAIFANKKPLIGFISALTLLLLLQILIFVVNESVLLLGLLPRMVIAFFLIVGIMSAKKYLATLKALKSHGVIVKDSEIV